MRASAFTTTIGIATAIALCAHAQDRTLTVDEVKNYFAQVQQEATDLVRRGDIEGIRQWSDHHIADDARFKVFVQALHDNKPKVWSAIDLDRADTEQMRSVLGATILRSIRDYSLRIEVGKVTPHGADAASVTATWTDSATIAPPAERAAEQGRNTVGQAAQTQPRAFNVKRRFECEHVLEREQGQLKLGLSSCTGQVQF